VLKEKRAVRASVTIGEASESADGTMYVGEDGWNNHVYQRTEPVLVCAVH